MEYIFFLLTFLSFIALILGLIKPKIVLRWGEETRKTRKKVLTWYGLALFVFFFAFAFSVPELTPEQKAEKAKELLLSAKAEVENKEYESARGKLEDALQYDPELKEALALLSETEKLEAHANAQNLIKKATELIEEQKYDKAKENLQDALGFAPDSKEASTLLSKIADLESAQEEKVKAEKEAKTKEKANKQAQKLKKEVEQLIADHKFEEAKKQMKTAQETLSEKEVEELNTKLAEQKSATERAEAQEEQKAKDKALTLVEKAEEYIDLHEYEKADELLKDALDLAPNLEAAKDWLPQIEVMKVAWEKELQNREEQEAQKNQVIEVIEPVYTDLGLTFTNLQAKRKSFLGYETTVITFTATNNGNRPFEMTNAAFILKKGHGNSIWPIEGTIRTDGGDFISIGMMPGDSVQMEQVYQLPDETLAGYDLLLPLTNGETIPLYYFY